MSFDWNAFVKAPDPQLTGNLAGATRERLRVIAAQFQRSVLPEAYPRKSENRDYSTLYCQQLYKVPRTPRP